MTGPTHYDVLGVAPTASAAELRRAFLEAARRHHPDVAGGDEARMRRLNEAWDVLGDPQRRLAYDRALVTRTPPDERPAAAPPRSDREDLLADLADDRPIGGATSAVRLPGWLSLIPPATFVLSVVVGFGGVLFTNPVLLAMGVVLFLTSCVLFLVSPFVALLASRTTGAGTADQDR